MALLGLWPETQGSSGVGTGILGSFWDFIKVVNFPFYFQEGTWDFLGNTAAKKVSGGLLLEKLTHSLQIEASKHRPVGKLCPTLATPWPIACQAPLFMGFSRQEYWSGLSFPSPGDLPHPGIEHTSPLSPALQVDFYL